MKTKTRPDIQGMKKGCQAHFKHMSGTCQAHIKHTEYITCALQGHEWYFKS